MGCARATNQNLKPFFWVTRSSRCTIWYASFVCSPRQNANPSANTLNRLLEVSHSPVQNPLRSGIISAILLGSHGLTPSVEATPHLHRFGVVFFLLIPSQVFPEVNSQTSVARACRESSVVIDLTQMPVEMPVQVQQKILGGHLVAQHFLGENLLEFKAVQTAQHCFNHA